MYEIVLMNEKGERFRKTYTSYYFYNKDLIKYKHAKRLTIVSCGKVGF